MEINGETGCCGFFKVLLLWKHGEEVYKACTQSKIAESGGLSTGVRLRPA